MNRASSPTGWVRNPDGTLGWTWNPITGCINHINGMCKGGNFPCYAYKLANGRLRSRYLANQNVAYCYYRGKELIGSEALLGKCNYSDPFYPRFWEDRLDELSPPLAKVNYERYGYQCRRFEPYRKVDRQPKGIFVCDMSDLFGIGIPEDWTKRVITMIKQNRQDRFYLLTKQPQNLIKFSPFPDNCWVGVTATNWLMFSDALGELAHIKAKVKYISFEPLLERIQLDELQKLLFRRGVLDWVIIGALTLTLEDYNNSNYALRRGLKLRRYGNKWTVQPDIEWVREIVEACDKAGIPVFLKDNLKPLLQQNNHNIYSFPEWAGTQFAITGNHSLSPVNPHPNEAMRKLRQELPEVKSG